MTLESSTPKFSLLETGLIQDTDYAKRLQSPYLLTRDDLAEQLQKYATTFKLNIMTSAEISSTRFDESSKRWNVNFSTPAGEHTVIAKHLVQATGIGSQKPYVPALANEELFNGITIHSSHYQNGKEMVEKGAKVSCSITLDHLVGRS